MVPSLTTTTSPPHKCWKNFKWRYLRNRSFDPLHVLFSGGVFGDGGSNGAISGSNKSKMAAVAIFEKFQMAIRSTSCLVIGWGFQGRQISNGAIFDSNKFKMAVAAMLDNFEWPCLRNG